jgi:hypothetical protein
MKNFLPPGLPASSIRAHGVQIDPELTYTQELARVLQAQIRAASIAQERVCGKGQSLAFDRALKRGQEALVRMLRKACDELGPIEDSEEGRRFLESLELGEIAAPAIIIAPPAEISETADHSANAPRVAGGGKTRPVLQGAAPTSKRRESGRTLPIAEKQEREPSAEEKSKEIMAQWR